ncbi:MAG: ATP-binding cassette domain-containing protein, partial [Steroidobacteraceae bacterium]
MKAYLDVRLRRIHVTRGERTVLHAIDWHILPGQHWVLVGANGAGKTQLLKLIAGAVWPVPEYRPLRCYRWGRQVRTTPYEAQDEIAYVGPERQDRYERYGWNHSVEQVIGTGIHRSDIPLTELAAADLRSIGALARRLEISALLPRRFLTLSYGERRLVLLARAMASRPRLLLMDELLNGLDATRHANALRFLGATHGSPLPWVLSVHRPQDVPAGATHALILEAGRITYRGPLSRAPLVRWFARAARPAGALAAAHRGPSEVP